MYDNLILNKTISGQIHFIIAENFFKHNLVDTAEKFCHSSRHIHNFPLHTEILAGGFRLYIYFLLNTGINLLYIGKVGFPEYPPLAGNRFLRFEILSLGCF